MLFLFYFPLLQFFASFLVLVPVWDPGPGLGPGLRPKLIPVLGPGPDPIILLVPAFIPVPSYFWSRPWSQSKFLFPIHSRKERETICEYNMALAKLNQIFLGLLPERFERFTTSKKQKICFCSNYLTPQAFRLLFGLLKFKDLLKIFTIGSFLTI